MKNYILIIAFTFGCISAQAQEFKATDKYVAMSEIVTKQDPYQEAKIHIMAQKDTSEKVATLTIPDVDIFEEVRITVLSDPDLKDIHEVVKVELEYLACCAYVETFYFLASDDGDFISLPSIGNTYCGMPESVEHYIFPIQRFGQEETIVRTKLTYTENDTIEEIEVLQSYAWNDDDFDYEDAVIVIQE